MDGGVVPDLAVMAALDAPLVQHFGDFLPAMAAQCRGEDIPHHLGFLGDDLRLQAVQAVAVGHGGRGEDAPLHPHPDAGPHVAGMVGGLHLGEACVDGGGLFRGEPASVDVLLLEPGLQTTISYEKARKGQYCGILTEQKCIL